MPKIIQGIVLRSIDYKEKDKLLTIYSLEDGKLSAILKGVKNANAKLKFAFQPFCFAEFSVEDKGVISNAELKESFFDLTLNYDRYLTGCKMLELVNLVTLENVSNPNIFLILIKSLNLLTNYENISYKLIFAKFLEEILSALGYKLNFNSCNNCGSKMLTSCYYDYSYGGIVCVGCKTLNSYKIPKEMLTSMKGITVMDFSNLSNLKITDNSLDFALKFLSHIYSEHFNRKFEF